MASLTKRRLDAAKPREKEYHSYGARAHPASAFVFTPPVNGYSLSKSVSVVASNDTRSGFLGHSRRSG